MSTDPVPPPPAVSRRRLRWLVPPAAAFVIVAGFGLGPSVIGATAGAGADPVLPAVSAQELVAKVLSVQWQGFSGTVQTNTNLGLPSIGSIGPLSSSLLSTLLSPHTLTVSAAPGGKFHVAIPDGLSETDLVSDGTQVWVWQSSGQTVTHFTKPADTGGTDAAPKPGDVTEPSPDALAKDLLSKADATTRVFVRGTTSVAGHDAYELVLAPTSSTTLVADVVIDVDAATGMPLRVQVLAKDAGTPALDVGFTSFTPGAPPASAFTFTPPPGAKVTEATSPEDLLFGPRHFGPGGPPAGPVDGAAGPRTKVIGPGGGSGPTRQKVVPAPGAPVPGPPVTTTDAKRQVVGTGWDAVLAMSDGPAALGAIGRPVSGSWGSGRLVTSTLADALVLDNGTVLVGMVGPDRLEAAVAELHQ